ARREFEGSWEGPRQADSKRQLMQLAERVEAHGEQLAQLEVLINGKSINLVRALEVDASVEFISYMAGWATKLEGRSLALSI
ncbi:aldehyde dehydrogenase family protein, partial [Pseudomonas aeruginosa]